MAKLRGGSNAYAVFIMFFALGFAMPFARVDIHSVESVMSRIGKRVEDSYSRQTELYSKAKGITVTPIKAEDPDKDIRQGSVPNTSEALEILSDSQKAFIESALDYKLKATKSRSRRLEALQGGKGAGVDGSDPATPVVKMLESARIKEDAAQQALSDAGYPDSVACLGEDGARVFVPRVLSVREVGTLSGIIARAAGIRIADVVIVQSR